MAETPPIEQETGMEVVTLRQNQQVALPLDTAEQHLTLVQRNLSTTQISAQTLNQTRLMEGDNNKLTFQGSTLNFQIGGNASPSKSVDSNKIRQEFLDSMRKYVLSVTTNSICSTYDNLNEIDPQTQPTMAVIDLSTGNEGKATRAFGDSKDQKNMMESGATEIKLSGLHKNRVGTKSNLTFLLGDVGAGKTTATEEYVRRVLDGKVEGLEDIEYVHYLSGSDIQDNEPTTAFDLLTKQIALDESTKSYGKNSLNKNTKKTLLVIDGLDQSSVDFSGKQQRVSNPLAIAKPSAIITSLLSGRLYPGMCILATSRWNTFWKLEKSIRCCRTVVLRGFDDKTLNDTIKTLAGEEDGNRISHALQTNASGLLPLCRNPMFLIYAIAIFKENTENPPDTITALMSALMKSFEGSDNWNSDLKTLMKLAYHGMKDNRYAFTEDYLKNIGIDPDTLGGILCAHVKLLSYQSRPATGDKTWSFPHQSLQEFLAALHVFTEGEQEFNRFAANELNKPEMEIIRKFVYGIVLNPATRKFCEAYLKDKSAQLEVCKHTLMKQIGNMISEGTIDDIKIISLLYECGPEVIQRYQSHVDRILISEEFLRPEDEQSLMSVIQKCAPMAEVQIQRLEMNPSFMEQISNTVKTVKKFQVNTITVGKHIQIEHCQNLTRLAPEMHTNHISLWTTEEIVNNLFQRWIDDGKAPCKNFALKGEFSHETFRKAGKFLSEVGAEYFCFNQCQLTKDKLKVLRDNVNEESKLVDLCIYNDGSMAVGLYEELTTIFNVVGVETLRLRECNLTTNKLESLNTGITRNNAKLENLWIVGEQGMEPDTYRSLACAMGNGRVKALVLDDNELTEEKLQEFGEGSKIYGVELREMDIRNDRRMKPGAYCTLAEAMKKANAQELTLGKMELTVEKLQAFDESAMRVQLQVYRCKYRKRTPKTFNQSNSLDS